MRVAIIGTVGVPANYGGFETLVECLLKNKAAEDLQYTVYCSSKAYHERLKNYKGAKLEYVPLKANGMQSIPYDILSLLRAALKNDVILMLGVSGCLFLPIFRLFSKKKLIINIDGLEHRRDKWKSYVRKILKGSEKMAVKYGDIIVADNKGIQDYVMQEYGVPSELIAYGGNQAMEEVSPRQAGKILSKYNLQPKEYYMGLCRIEPENNVHLILEAFSGMPDKNLIFIGNWEKNSYSEALKEKYSSFPNIKLLDPEYNSAIINTLRKNCIGYLHGHSAGGTNPSLVEAMFSEVPVIAYDCVYNRETTEGKAFYFSEASSLRHVLTEATEGSIRRNTSDMQEIAQRRYRWETIASQYEALY